MTVEALGSAEADQPTAEIVGTRRNQMKRVFLRRIVLLAAIVGLATLPCSVAAQDKSLKKIIWGQTSISSSQWIPWIAKDAKIYRSTDWMSISYICAAVRGTRRKRSLPGVFLRHR